MAANTVAIVVDPQVTAEADVATSVFIICGGILLSLSVCWGAYWTLSAAGRPIHTLKLSLLCLSFAACSWAMNVLNKALVTSLNAPTLVTGAQMAMTVVFVLLTARDKLVNDKAQMIKWSFVPLLFFGMLVSSFFTFEYLSLSMLMIVRNLGPIVTLPIEMAVMPLDKQPVVDPKMLLALMIMLAGAASYGGAITLSWYGLGFAFLNMVLAIADRVAQRKLLTSTCKDLSTETCVLLNNLLGCVPTAIMAFNIGEIAKVDTAVWFHSSTTVLLLLSGIIGSGICYFAIAVQREISATSFMVLQNTARMAVVVAGIVIFRDPVDSSSKVLGLLLSFGGAIFYGKTQMEAVAAAKLKAKLEETTDPEKEPLMPK